jgi:hypothetical protein
MMVKSPNPKNAAAANGLVDQKQAAEDMGTSPIQIALDRRKRRMVLEKQEHIPAKIAAKMEK